MPNIADYGLPLLARELGVRANRKRTYAVRTVYALAILIVVGIGVAAVLRDSDDLQFGLLGHGRELFQVINTTLFIGIYVFVPAMTSGGIAMEKQRQTLSLLMLTRLGRWAILFEKLLAGLIPSLTLLILSVPMMAAMYPLGGMSQESLTKAVWILLVAILQASCAGLFCSTLFRNVSTALLATYVLLFVWMLGLVLGAVILGFAVASEHRIFFPYGIYRMEMVRPTTSFIKFTLPLLGCSLFLFVLSRFTLIWFAFRPVTAIWGLVVSKLSRTALEQHEEHKQQNSEIRAAGLSGSDPSGVTASVVRASADLPRGSHDGPSTQSGPGKLPSDEPILWQIRHKTWSGNWKAMSIAIGVAFVALIVPAITSMKALNYSRDPVLMTTLLFFLWGFSSVVFAIRGAGLFSSDKSRQTLNVLLATPIPMKEIVLQKAKGLRPFIAAFVLPILFCALWTMLFRSQQSRWISRRYDGQYVPFVYLCTTILCLIVYPRFVLWFGIYLGMRIRGQVKAIMTTLVLLLLWLAFPMACGFVPHITLNWFPQPPKFMLISPLLSVVINEFASYREFNRHSGWFLVVLFVCISLILHEGLTRYFRSSCIRNAGRLLGRGES